MVGMNRSIYPHQLLDSSYRLGELNDLVEKHRSAAWWPDIY